MKKANILFLLLFTYCIPSISQIYYKEIIYVFDYTIEKKDGTKENGIIYLGCLGKSWPFKGEKQAAIVWTIDKDYLKEKRLTTGAFEEENLIWIHPPREDKFSILEYSPCPFIHFPISANKSWKRELALGEHWANKEHNIKADDILKFSYINSGPVAYKLKFKNKEIECWKIEAESINMKDKTSSYSLFNAEYGFVKMSFKNVDNSIITLELNHIENWDAILNRQRISSFSLNSY